MSSRMLLRASPWVRNMSEGKTGAMDLGVTRWGVARRGCLRLTRSREKPTITAQVGWIGEQFSAETRQIGSVPEIRTLQNPFSQEARLQCSSS